MKILVLILFALLFTISLFAQNTTPADVYQYQIDLLNIKDDKVNVSFSLPKTKIKRGKFIVPKFVPGYYDAMNFGQYISQFKAVDSSGKAIQVDQLDTNTWQVSDLEHTARISYEVSDGWESLLQNTGGAKSPASMFKKDSLAIVNFNALVGYFEEIKDAAYNITLTKPSGFFASSAMDYEKKNDTTDAVTAVDYRHLVDAPLLYCLPDTTWLNIGQTKVLVSFYSKENRNYSDTLASKLKSILENQRAYLGGKLPVNEYAFLIYHEIRPKQGLYGDGLEHSQSTMCLYAAKDISKLPQALMHLASHEFLHILSPLNIHSDDIQHFDFLNPVFSKHLWLYEGMTEYATIHMPIKQQMISLEEFTGSINEKIKGMEKFDNSLSMTEMSSKAVERQDQYMNFYQKGALVGLCLDIRLRELSKGSSGTQQMMQELMKRYGPNKSFRDEELFDVITQLTQPGIRQFFKDFIESGKAIPLKTSLRKVGFSYDEKTKLVTINKAASRSQLKLRKAWIGI